jgi:3-deoxy-manno-octulosonate cytidylyltransferase (CMP-KDO synthetase)
LLEKEQVEIGTLVKPISDSDTLIDPNKVKVVLGAKNEALYFSRSAIPFVKNTSLKDWTKKHTFYKHLGLYGYKMDTLNEISHMQPTVLEEAEGLEQLRWLENGKKIYTAITRHESLSIDTPEDLKKAEKMLEQHPEKS